ncbi:hypothetical protein [Seleniivibrio woodruffii]|uniref:hypothetical protein n=1 Tax=Seleniivibrio woodruffii TaxID=1078050 RepID=UPI0026F34CC8|nr:hypothetical protein [Seleniivibrio woodruffii]
MIHKKTHCLIMIFAVAMAVQTADAFDVGDNIKAVGKSGKVYEAKIASVALNKSVLLIKSDGAQFKVPVSDIRSIQNVEGEFFTAANGTPMKVVKIVTRDGKTITGGVNVSAAIAVEHKEGNVTNLMIPDMHRFTSIESNNTIAVSSLK